MTGIAVRASVYALQAGRVLLFQREAGWAAPGGEVAPGEAPYEAGGRHLQKQTGLLAGTLILRGLVTLVSQETGETTLEFLYACNNFSGKLKPASGEQRSNWQHLHRVFHLPMPEVSQRVLTYALNLNLPLYQAKIVHDAGGRVVATVEFDQD